MITSLTARVYAVHTPKLSTGERKIVGYEWVLYAANGRPLAQQVRHSVSERAAWAAFRLFCAVAQDISDEPWESA